MSGLEIAGLIFLLLASFAAICAGIEFRKLALVALGFAGLALVVIALIIDSREASAACDAAGGVLLKSAAGQRECVAVERVEVLP